MAIVFTCDCGKRLQAKEEFAGRRMKCPKCQATLTIPPAGTIPPVGESAEKVTPTVPPSTSHLLRASQQAGVSQQAGRSSPQQPDTAAANPDTGVTNRPPRAAQAQPDFAKPDYPKAPDLAKNLARTPDLAESPQPSGLRAKPPPAAAPPSPFAQPWDAQRWDTTSFDQRATPWPAGSAQAGNPGPLDRRDRRRRWVLPLAIVLVLIGAAVSWAVWLRPKPPARGGLSDLDVVPPDAAVFVSVRVADLWSVPRDENLNLLGPAVARFWATVQSNWADRLEGMIGVKPEEVERLTLVVPALPQGFAASDPLRWPRESGWLAVQTQKPYAQAAVLDKALGHYRVSRHQGIVFHEAHPEPDSGVLHFVNERVFVRTWPAGVDALLQQSLQQSSLQQSSAPKASGAQTEALALAAAGKHHLVACLSRGLTQVAALMGKDATKELGLPQQIRTVTVTLDEGQALAVKVAVTFDDQTAAAKAHDALRSLLMRAMDYVLAKKAEFDKKDGLPRKLVATAEATLNGVRLQVKETEVEAQFQVEGGSAALAAAWHALNQHVPDVAAPAISKE